MQITGHWQPTWASQVITTLSTARMFFLCNYSRVFVPTFDIPLPPTPLCQDPLITTLEKPAVEAVERRFSHTYKYLHANANEHFVKPLTLKTMCTHCTVHGYTSLDASLFTNVCRLTSWCVFKGLVCECVHVCVCVWKSVCTPKALLWRGPRGLQPRCAVCMDGMDLEPFHETPDWSPLCSRVELLRAVNTCWTVNKSVSAGHAVLVMWW